MKVYCFGNEFVKLDSLAKELGSALKVKGVEFVMADSPEEIEGDNVVILDVAQGIKKVVVLDDVSKLKKVLPCSCHDLDLGFYLQLKKEIGSLGSVKIICVPMDYGLEKAKKEVLEVLKKIIPK